MNVKSTDHFYTTSREKEHLANYNFIRVECYILKDKKQGAVMLHRYYAKAQQNHFYSINLSNEHIEGYLEEFSPGWVFPDNSFDKKLVPLFRFRNDELADHFYTIDPDENLLMKNGYRKEKIECYVYKNPTKETSPLELWAMKGSPLIYNPRTEIKETNELKDEEQIVHDPKSHKMIKWGLVVAIIAAIFAAIPAYEYFVKKNEEKIENKNSVRNSHETNISTRDNNGGTTTINVDNKTINNFNQPSDTKKINEENPIANIDPIMISKSIDSAPILKRQQIASCYIGNNVKWFLELSSLGEEGAHRVRVSCFYRNSLRFVVFSTDIEKYPFLKFAKGGEKFETIGKIIQCGEREIELELKSLKEITTKGTNQNKNTIIQTNTNGDNIAGDKTVINNK